MNQIDVCSGGAFVDVLLQTLGCKQGQGHRRFDAQQPRVQLEGLSKELFSRLGRLLSAIFNHERLSQSWLAGIYPRRRNILLVAL